MTLSRAACRAMSAVMRRESNLSPPYLAWPSLVHAHPGRSAHPPTHALSSGFQIDGLRDHDSLSRSGGARAARVGSHDAEGVRARRRWTNERAGRRRQGAHERPSHVKHVT